MQIADAIKREPQHILDYLKAELDTEGNFGSEENLILQGRFKDKHITAIYKRYLEAYVKCTDCRRINTEMTRDSSTRLQNLKCLDCGATRTVQNIKRGYHATRRGERKKEKNKAWINTDLIQFNSLLKYLGYNQYIRIFICI